MSYYVIIKIPIKGEFQQIASKHSSSDVELKVFMKLQKDYTKETSSFLLNNTTFPSYNSLRFRKSLL